MVVPQRQPVLTAKMLATIDILSSGRLIVGCGVGWLKEEFEALGAPPYAERGRATDEYIDAFKALWTEDAPTYRGKHVSFDNVMFAPKPVPKPHPPIWIGGESAVAIKRTVRAGEGWYPASNNPQHRLDTPERLRAGMGELRRAAEAARRDPASIDVGYLVLWPVDWSAQKTTRWGQQAVHGPIRGHGGGRGCTGAGGRAPPVPDLPDRILPETLERMQRFAEEVMPLVK